jgi:hypothetical protein
VLNRKLLDAFHDHPLLLSLRQQTQLDETQAGLGTVLIGEQLLALARDEQLLPRGDLLDLWDLERQEEELRNRGEEAKDLDGWRARAIPTRPRPPSARAARSDTPPTPPRRVCARRSGRCASVSRRCRRAPGAPCRPPPRA